MKIKKINIPIYHGWLEIALSDDLDLAYVKLGYKISDNHKEVPAAAFVDSRFDDNGVSRYSIFLRPDCSHGTIAHETVHLVSRLFGDRNIDLSIENDEPAAYMTGWFAEQIYNTLESWGGK